jgi:dTDP-4-dehydrorhamnose 3,5-epimerase
VVKYITKKVIGVPHMPIIGVKDIQTVTPEGELVEKRIEGVNIRYAKTITDDRGTVCEMFSTDWGFHPDPLVFVYQVSIRPGKVKGWVVHRTYDDRAFVSRGTIKFALYDDRPDSPTYKMLNILYFDDHNRALVTIPRGVFHALQNVGTEDAYFYNMPTKGYQHADPDKERLPLNTDKIPYSFK